MNDTVNDTVNDTLNRTVSNVVGWAIRVHKDHALACGALRLRGGIEACPDASGDIFWLRGPELSEDLAHDLRKLAADGIFNVWDDGAVLREGCRLPIDRLPATGWQPLDRWLSPVAQSTVPAATLSSRLALTLERDADERPSSVLLTTLDSWAAYAQAAPSVRLSVLMMAASQDGRVIVRGTPLPSIRGMRYVESAGIAVPSGWTIRPRVDASVLASLLALGKGDLALFRTDGSFEQIPARCFARCTRAVIRQTLAERPV